jgi:hypothetical protein
VPRPGSTFGFAPEFGGSDQAHTFLKADIDLWRVELPLLAKMGRPRLTGIVDLLLSAFTEFNDGHWGQTPPGQS